MSAIIPAAGLGTRIRDFLGIPGKQLLRINGLELIMYPVINLWMRGVRSFIVVTNPVVMEQVDAVLYRYSSMLGYEYELVFNPYKDSGNGYSLILGLREYVEKYGKGRVYVAVADHIHHPSMIEELVDSRLRGDIIVIGDDKGICIDREEATKIKTDQYGNILAIGKELREYNYIDTGLFIINNPGKILSDNKHEDRKLEISGILMKTTYTRKVHPCTRNCYWVDIDTPKDLELLIRNCRDKTIIPFIKLFTEKPGKEYIL